MVWYCKTWRKQRATLLHASVWTNVKFVHNVAHSYYLHLKFVWAFEVSNICHPVLEERIIIVRVLLHKSARNMHIHIISVSFRWLYTCLEPQHAAEVSNNTAQCCSLPLCALITRFLTSFISKERNLETVCPHWIFRVFAQSWSRWWVNKRCTVTVRREGWTPFDVIVSRFHVPVIITTCPSGTSRCCAPILF